MFQKIYNKCRDKNIIVYLPDDYYQSEERYPVLYMNDGQNAFFDDQAYIGVSWGMEDYLKKSDLKVIVVAIPCVFSEYGRASEYGPWNVESGVLMRDESHELIKGTGEDYCEWLIHDLKPYIDGRYRTLEDDTAMVGSSSGGVITAYACMKHPDVFHKGAAVSTAYWLYQKEFIDLVKTSDLSGLERFYFDVGGKEGYDDDSLSQDYLWSNNEIEYLIRQKGIDYMYRVFEHDVHSEACWRNRVPVFMSYLYGGGKYK